MKFKTNRFLALAAITSALATFSASAIQYKWVGTTDTDWATTSNWDTNGIAPTNGTFTSTRLNVNNGGTNFTKPATYNFPGVTTIYASDVASGSRGIVIGSTTNGSMIISAGTLSTVGSVGADLVGNGNGFTGTLTITGGEYISNSFGFALGAGGGTGRVSELTVSGTGKATITRLDFNCQTANIYLNGGTLQANQVVYTSVSAASKIRLNGGTLKAGATQTSPAFIPSSGNVETLVQAGGAIIDTAGFDITIAEPLLEDATSTGGGLTKNSLGLLTLGAPNTLTGAVDVNAGGLGVKGGATSWAPSSFTHSGNALNFDLGVYGEFNPVVIETGALTVDSAITVNVTGSNFQVGQIPLIAYSSKDFTGGSFTLNPATLPSNVEATLIDDNAGLIYLNVTAAPTTYVWSGDTSTPGIGIWDTTSLTWNSFTNAFSTSGTQIVQFPDLTGGGTATITGDYSPLSIGFTNGSGNHYVINGTGKITGATVVNKTGAGRVTLNGAAHSYSGATTISTGAIIKKAADATTGAITVANNATFALDGGVTTGAGQTLTLSGPGAIGADYFYTGSAVQRGSLQAQNGANTWSGNVILTTTGNTRIGVQNGASLTIGGTITESAAGVSPTFRAGDAGDNITLSGVCSWTGDTIMFSTGGSIKLGGNDRLPTSSNIKFTGSATVFDLNGNNQQVRGITDFNPTVTNGGATPSVLTLSPLVATTTGFFGLIVDGTESISVVNSGDGTTILGGNNTYSGTTTVNSGTLLINGNQIGATGAVQVNGGTLGGTATIGGAVTVASGAKIAPGTDGTIETLDIAANTAIAGTFACDVNAATTDRLVVTGDLALTSSTLAINPVSPATPGSYVIATYTGTRTGTLGGTLPAGYSVTYDDTNKEVELVIVGTGYSQWATTNNVLLGENGDDDNDGLINLVEYALGLNPQASSVPAGTFVGNLLTFTKGPEAKAAGDVTYTIEISTTLDAGSWSPAAATDTADTISFQLPANQPGGKLFARLRVTKP